MKKIFSILVLTLLCSVFSFGQNVRERMPANVVNEVLAKMPCTDSVQLAQRMLDLALSAPGTVVVLGERLGEERMKSRAEYALSSLAVYASHPSNAAFKDGVRTGFVKAIDAQADPVNRQFLLAQLRLIATEADIEWYKQYAGDPLSGPAVLSTIADLGGKDAILGLVESAGASKAALADIIADRGWREAEPALLRWAAAPLAESAEKAAIAAALGRIGGSASLSWLKANSMSDYMVALGNLPAKKAVKKAKEVLKTGSSGLKCAAAGIIMEKASKRDGLKLLQDILKSDDRPLRNAALSAATASYGADAVAPVLTGKFAKLSEGAKTDVINWLGVQKKGLDIVLNALDAPGELGDAAVRTAGILGGPAACEALVSQLAGPRSDLALSALESFPGDMAGTVVQALQAPVNETQLNNLMTLASTREIKEAALPVLARATQGSPVAASALAGLVTPQHAEALSALLRNATSDQVPALQQALLAALHTLTPAEQTARVRTLMEEGAPERFCPVLAGIGTDEAAEVLRALAPQNPAAKEALLSMDHPTVLPDLLASAKEGNEASLKKYVNLLAAYDKNADRKCLGLEEAIRLARNPAIRSLALGKLGDMPLMKSFLLASQSLDDEDAAVRMAAADAVKKIASRCAEEINYDDYKAALEKARALYVARGYADDGYAVDEIDKMLLEARPVPRDVRILDPGDR